MCGGGGTVRVCVWGGWGTVRVCVCGVGGYSEGVCGGVGGVVTMCACDSPLNSLSSH